PAIRLNRGMLLLPRAEFAKGWIDYEARTATGNWNGSDLHGKRIVLQGEQGFGDVIQFSRYAPMVAERGGRVILRCRPELVRLMKTLDGVSDVVSTADPTPQTDFHVPLLSLPRIFGTTLANIPANV